MSNVDILKPLFLQFDKENNVRVCRKRENYDMECKAINEIDELLDFIRN